MGIKKSEGFATLKPPLGWEGYILRDKQLMPLGWWVGKDKKRRGPEFKYLPPLVISDV